MNEFLFDVLREVIRELYQVESKTSKTRESKALRVTEAI